MKKVLFFTILMMIVFFLGMHAPRLLDTVFDSFKDDPPNKDGNFNKEKVQLVMDEIGKEKKKRNRPLHEKSTGGVPTYTNADIEKDEIRSHQRKKEGNNYTEKDLLKLKQKGGGNLVVRAEKSDKTTKPTKIKDADRTGVEKFFDTLRKEAGDIVEKAKQLVQKPEFKDNPAIKEMMNKNPEQMKSSIQDGVERRNKEIKFLNKNIDKQLLSC